MKLQLKAYKLDWQGNFTSIWKLDKCSKSNQEEVPKSNKKEMKGGTRAEAAARQQASLKANAWSIIT